MSSLKVSIIVPVYNTQAYLATCLTSLVNQTLDDIEILVINDGSLDDSQKIIDEYVVKYPAKIKSFVKKNGGLSDARNYGIEQATAAFIGFVDSDDYVSEEMFEQLYLLTQKHQAEIAICDLVKVNEAGKEFKLLPQSPQLSEKIVLKDDFTFFGEMSCFACNKLFKRSLFKELRFKKDLHFEDIELIPQLVLKADIIAKVNQPLYKYFEREGSLSESFSMKGTDLLKAVSKVSAVFEQSQYQDQKKELKRFQILQGYYSYMAYVAKMRNPILYLRLTKEWKGFKHENEISARAIKQYQRFGINYLSSLSQLKQLYYWLHS